MKSVESRLILFLADQELSDAEFERLVELLHSSQLSRCISAASHLRQGTHSAAEHIKRLRRESLRNFDKRVDSGFLKELSLLLQDMKLSPTEAVRFIAEELGLDQESPQPRSFRGGIARLLDSVDMDAIWSAAQRLKAKAATRSHKNPWPLRGSKESDARV